MKNESCRWVHCFILFQCIICGICKPSNAKNNTITSPMEPRIFPNEVLTTLFIPYFYNAFHCFSLIMLVCFNLFLHVAPNWNGLTRIWSARYMSLWYHTHFWYFYRNLFTLSGLTDNIFSTVPSFFISLIPGKNIFHCKVLGEILSVYYVPLTSLHPIIPHANRIRLLNINLYQVPFSLCWPYIHILDEKELTLWN